MKKLNKGFTLIELLVVIAIIGILASVVLASLNSARTKGKDASAKTSITSVRAQAEIYYNGTGANSYGPISSNVTTGGVCGDSQVLVLNSAANTQTGHSSVCTQNASGAAAATSYTDYVQLNDSTYFCVDSTGFAGIAGDPTAVGTTYVAGVKCQ